MQQIYGGTRKLSNIWRYIKFQWNFLYNNPDYFRYDGLTVFTGPQGAGKTLSAVLHYNEIVKQFPKCVKMSNIKLKGIDYIPYKSIDDLPGLFKVYDNQELGILVFMDEIHILLDALESNKVTPEVLAMISQQRKRRIHFVGTTQVFARMPKPMRQNFKQVVSCRQFMGFLQINTVGFGDETEEVNGKLKFDVKAVDYFFIDPSYFDLYDTSELVDRGLTNKGRYSLREDLNREYTPKKD